MKYLLCVFALFITHIASSQKLPADGVNKVRITLADKAIVAEITPLSSNPKPVASLWYWWYSAGTIHATEGGYEGKLLNGKYQEFYANKNLQEEGFFKKGLKDGCWKTWNFEGTLTETTFWKKGVQVSDKKLPILKRLNIFKKNRSNSSTDTVKNKADLLKQ